MATEPMSSDKNHINKEMTESIKKLEELRVEVSALIEDGKAESLERARTLLNHQQLLLRQVIDDQFTDLTLAERAEVETAFGKANEELLEQNQRAVK